jgi:Flp pilus assembly protein TadD
MKKKALKTSPLLAKMLAKSGDEATKTITTIQQHVASFKLEIKDAIGLHQAGQLQAAAAKYQQLLKADLDENQQARVLSLLATTLLQQQQFNDAAQTFQAALKLNPHDASTHNNLGVCLKQLGNKALAIKHFKQAVDLDGNYADALNNYAAALIDERQQLEAISYLDQAIAIKPDYADSHYNRGTALQSLKRFDEAEESFQRALAINPQFISALFNSGLLRLLRGEFEQGWRLYEYRWQDVQAKQYVHNFSQPLWLGDADLSGKTIYLYAEQGLGDFIQFSRYALMVEKMAAKVILLVPAELMSLATSLSKNIVYIQRKGTETAIDLAFDYHCPILSLPLAFKTDITSIPANVPYLEVPIDKKNLG